MSESQDRRAIRWLLRSDEPAISALARRDLLDDHQPGDEELVLTGRKVQTLLAGQREDGGFGTPVYRKWTGAHWRLVSLVELGLPAHHVAARRAVETVLAWLAGARHRSRIRTVDGLVRRCASQEGNAVAVACRLGLADDPRVAMLAESLVEWQWPDGGWNCDLQARGTRSSFHESLIPMWGLHEYAAATGHSDARAASLRTAELLLGHHVFRATRSGEPIHPSWIALHYPPYWHYDVLQAMLVLARMGLAADPRAADAVEVLERSRLPDGRWRAGRRWWRPPGTASGSVEVVDWGRSGPSEMVTLNALRVLRSVGRVAANESTPSR
jgi:hypothetical protein